MMPLLTHLSSYRYRVLKNTHNNESFCEGSLTPLPAAEAWAGRRVSVPLEHWITLLAAEAAAVEFEAAESPAAASS